MNIVGIVYFCFLAAWIMGLVVDIYHVYNFHYPGDAATKMLWGFLIFSGVVFLLSINIFASSLWGGGR